MGQISPKLRAVTGGYAHWCPGCAEVHIIFTPRWSFNGDLEQPHFEPSVKITSGHYVAGQEGKRCWCDYNREHPDEEDPFTCGICHYFLHQGELRYCDDSTHALKGQTIPLPDLPPEYQDDPLRPRPKA